jgi:uncharacterized protein YdeI (YjbR/CyaY-like superfamily)
MAAKKPYLSELQLVEVKDRARWRKWLEKNHSVSPGIWLAIGKKGNAVSDLRYEEAIEEALAFGWIDGMAGRVDADRYKLLVTPRKPGSGWARTNKKRVERLLAEGRMTPAGLAAVELARENGSWTMLDDVEALVEPTDLTAALDADPGARQGWDALGASPRKMALYWIATAKRPETRADRIEQTVAAAAEGRAPR